MKKLYLFCSIIVSSLFLATISYASYGTQHVLGGNFNGPTPGGFGVENAEYWMDSSVTAVYDLSVSNAAKAWGEASQYYTFSRDWTLAVSTNIQVYVQNLPSGIYGTTSFYKRVNSTWQLVPTADVISGASNFDMAKIILGSNNMGNHTSQEIYHNTAHEWGHAMSLYHFENYPSHSGNHFMKSGKISLTTATDTDKDHYRYKWEP